MRMSTNLQKKGNDDILFSILTDITAAQTTGELLETIFSKLSKVIDFDDVGLFQVLEDGRHRDLAVVINSNYGANRKIKQNLQTDWLKPEKGLNALLHRIQINLLSDFSSSYPNHPHLEFIYKEKLKQFISSPLKRNDATFGVFILWSKSQHTYSEKDFRLFSKIADMIAVVLSNILDKEALMEEKTYNETLLSISETVSTIQNKQQLLKLIFEKLETIVPYDNPGFFVIDSEKDEFYEILEDEYIENDLQNKLAKLNLLGPWQYSGHPDDSFLYTKRIRIFNILEESKTSPNPQWNHMIEFGLKEILIIPLFYINKKQGFLCFNKKQEGFYKESNFPLYKAIGDQVSVALNNVLSNEQILREKEFSETLLLITEAVAQVTDKEGLYRTIFDIIEPVFPFDELGLFIIDENADQHYELISQKDLPRNISLKAIEKALGKHTRYKHKGSSIEWMIQNGPVFLTIEQLEENAHHPQHKYMINSGLKSLIGGPLMTGGKAFGMFCFTSTRENYYNDGHLKLFKSIAEQISTATTNIISNQKLVDEKNFKEILLEVSEAVNKTKNRTELYNTIISILRPELGFADAVLCLIDNENGTHIHPHTAAPDTTIEHPLYKLLVENHLPNKGSPMEKILEGDDVSTLLLSEWIERYPDYPGFLLMKDVGLEFSITLTLKHQDANIGILFVHFTSPQVLDDFTSKLYYNLRNTISVALSNILAQESLEKEKQFSESLLEITEAVAQVNNVDDLYKSIFQIIKPVFPYDELGLFVVDYKNDSHYEIITAETYVDSAIQKKIEDTFGEQKKYKHSHSSIEWLMDNGPVALSLVELDSHAPHPQHKMMIDGGLKAIIGGPLNSGGKTIGMLCFTSLTSDYYRDDQLVLFKSISDQIATATSNILSNLQILKEKQFSDTLLHITEEIASSTSSKDLYEKICSSVKSVLPFHQVGVLIYDESVNGHYELINESDVKTSSINTKLGELGKRVVYDHCGTSVEWLMDNGPVIVSMEFLDEITNHPRHIDMVNAGIKTLLGGPLYSNGKLYGMMAVKSKIEDFYTEEHLKLFKSISEQVSVSVANILYNKEILLKNEIQNLELNISNILTSEKATETKWDYILQYIKKFVPFTYAMVAIKKNKELHIERLQWLSNKERRKLNKSQLELMTQLSVKEIDLAEKRLIENRITNDSLKNKKAKNTVEHKFMQQLSLNSNVRLEVELGDKKTTLYLILFSNRDDVYTSTHFDILEKLSNTLKISMDNMLASESIKMMSEQLKLEKSYLQTAVNEAYNFESMIGESKSMLTVFDKIKEVSAVDATTLILGETGTGKELIARAIHENSNRKDHILVKVNCAAIPSQIVESELFGHEKGSFTGAFQQRIGKFELANQGTIFLDEIGEMPLELQTKLLRVLQEREVERLGGNKTIKLNIRVIAATNKNLTEEIANGKFRSDLYYRLNGYPINVPPLRAREEDVLLLADFSARQFSERYGIPFKGFTQNTLNRFKQYDWPGNVRELQNIIEQGIISQKGEVIDIFPGRVNQANLDWDELKESSNVSSSLLDEFDMEDIKNEKDKLEKAYLLKIIEQTKWRVSGKDGAARILGIAPSTLESRMKKLGIKR